jgi:septal ring factor EnvC (AmiA/AmiB activator)
MDEAAAPQARDRLTRWIEESREILALLPELVDAAHKASAKGEQAERESDKLRRELAELRKELGDVKEHETGRAKQHGEIEKEIEELRKQNEMLKAEKDEVAQAFAKLLDTMQSTNQIAQKLGVTKSPFARHKEPTAPPHE